MPKAMKTEEIPSPAFPAGVDLPIMPLMRAMNSNPAKRRKQSM
jgi:hypothetical protein